MVSGIIFDMDGLMFDTERLSLEGWVLAGKQMKCAIAEEIVIKTLGLNAEDTKRVFADNLGENFDYFTAKRISDDYVISYIKNKRIPIKTGLVELLDYLNTNHYKFTVATSSDTKTAHYYFEAAGISKCFNKIVCGDMVKRGKPAPDIYLRASEIIGVSPNECLVLEDSPFGILAAYTAGMKPVMIPDLVQPGEKTSGMLFAKLQTLSEVKRLLSEQTGRA